MIKNNPIIQQSNNERGFTFIELILYISIVTIMLSALIPFAWNVIEGGSKSSVEQEVFSQGRYVSERLKYEIRNAEGLDAGVSNFDVNLADNPSFIVRLTQPPPTNYYDINVTTDGQAQITPGDGGAVKILNSTDTKVTDLTFTNYTSSDNKTKHIQFSFTMDDTGISTRQEYQVSEVNIEASAEVRSN